MNERSLLPELQKWFDSRLLTGEVVEPFVSQDNPTKMLIACASACVGVQEEGRDNFGPVVSMFQNTIGGSAFEPWCASFLQSCIAYVETYGFKSNIFPTEHVLTMWNESKPRRVEVPKSGDLVLWRMGQSLSGHAGIITEIMPKAFKTIEGNTGPAIGIVRDGDGVYRKKRLFDSSSGFKILGFLRPF